MAQHELLISGHHALLIKTHWQQRGMFVTSTCWQIRGLQGQQMAERDALLAKLAEAEKATE